MLCSERIKIREKIYNSNCSVLNASNYALIYYFVTTHRELDVHVRKIAQNDNWMQCASISSSHGDFHILNRSIEIVSKAEISTTTTGVFKIRYTQATDAPDEWKTIFEKSVVENRSVRGFGFGIETVGEFTIHSSNKCTLTMKIEVLEWNERANKLLPNCTWPESAVYRIDGHCIAEREKEHKRKTILSHEKYMQHMHHEIHT